MIGLKWQGLLTLELSSWCHLIKPQLRGCILASYPAVLGSNPGSAKIFSIYCLVCGQYWDRTHLVLSNGFHKCSYRWRPELRTTKTTQSRSHHFRWRWARRGNPRRTQTCWRWCGLYRWRAQASQRWTDTSRSSRTLQPPEEGGWSWKQCQKVCLAALRC